MKDFEIKESNISGKGIFALRDFKEGEMVLDWHNCAKLISEKQYRNLSSSEKECVQILNGVYRYFLAPARYINHSCYNNTEPREIGDFAIRNIRAGEEITTNYSGEDGGLDFVCNCGECS